MIRRWQPAQALRPAKNPDAGAREIHHLLTARNPSLERALKAQATTLQRGLKLSEGARPRLEIPAATVDAVKLTRGIFRDLRTRIAAIETKKRDVKQRVLRALDLLDSSLTLFVRGLGASSDAAIAEFARQAYWQRAHAYAQLQTAVKDLQ